MNKHAEIHAAWPVVCSYLDVNLARRPAHAWRTRANAPHPSRPHTAPCPDEKHDPSVRNPGQREGAMAAHGRRGCSARKRSPATTGPTRGLTHAAVSVAARAPEAGPPGPRSPSAPRDRTSPVDLRLRFRASSVGITDSGIALGLSIVCSIPAARHKSRRERCRCGKNIVLSGRLLAWRAREQAKHCATDNETETKYTASGG